MRFRGLMVSVAAAVIMASAARAQAPRSFSAEDRDALSRVAVAEAANQGESGLAAVVQTVLNRLASGQWGSTVGEVVNAPHQFEPVMRVGGDWRRLPPPTPAQRTVIETILNLMREGRLPDFIGGALFFQNPKIVASRAADGRVSPSLVNFGGQAPTVVIGDHSFFAGRARGGGSLERSAPADGAIFVAKPRTADMADVADGGEPTPAPTPPDPARAIFILSDGALASDRPQASLPR